MESDYAGMLYGQSGGLGDVARAARGMVSRDGAKINALLFACSGDPAAEFAEWMPAGRRPGAAGRGAVQVLSMGGEGGSAPVRVAVAGDPRTPSIRCAVSDCPPALFRSRFASMVGRRVPALWRIVLTSGETAEILDGVAEAGLGVAVRRASIAMPRSGGGLDSHTRYIDEPHEKFLAGLGRAASLKTIKVVCTAAGLASEEGETGPATLTMTRDCHFSASGSAKIL